mgnify:FL=1
MPRSSRPRRARRPRLVAEPVTVGLLEQIRRITVASEIAMRVGAADTATYNDVASLLDSVGAAVLGRLPEHHADAISIQSACLTMIAAGKRWRGDLVPFSPADANAIARGLDAIERHVPELTTTADIKRAQIRALRARANQSTTEESTSA